MATSTKAIDHPFVERPNRTMFVLSVPVLLSLVAEPVTGIVDTAFVARLGTDAMAALGVGTVVLSGSFWIFNFLGIGTQTNVAQALGEGDDLSARETSGLAMAVAAAIGFGLLLAGLPTLQMIAGLMGAEGTVADLSASYMRWRLLGAPAVLVTLAAFGSLRGLQLMKVPLWIAIAVNVINVVLDALLIFGLGPIPAMGVVGAAIASSISQWIGALLAVMIVTGRLGWPRRVHWREAGALLVVGRDLFLRTGFLTLFLILGTRSATRAGADAGAAHQAIRQIWTFTALFLDSFAITGQSLIGYFLGARWVEQARRVAAYVCGWSFATGCLLAAAMLLTTDHVAALLVPDQARGLFRTAWWLAAVAQPFNALAFGTDGIHWGTGDFTYLRNAMIVSTAIGAAGLFFLDEAGATALAGIWWITSGWIAIRTVFGMIRIWPGVWGAPLRSEK